VPGLVPGLKLVAASALLKLPALISLDFFVRVADMKHPAAVLAQIRAYELVSLLAHPARYLLSLSPCSIGALVFAGNATGEAGGLHSAAFSSSESIAP